MPSCWFARVLKPVLNQPCAIRSYVRGFKDGKLHSRKLPQHQGIDLHKGKSQHILKNSSIVESIVRKAGISQLETVLEIGPGTGNMTLELLKVAKKVIAIEIDPRMILEVRRRVEGSDHAHKLEVIHGDILQVQLPEFDVCVANIPYKISSPIVFKLLAHRPLFRRAVIMFQREFARRLVAKPGDSLFCRLAINTQLLADVNHELDIRKGNFQPAPKVDSTVVSIIPHNSVPALNFKEWDNLIRICFSRKNKTLGSIFKQKNVLRLVKDNFKHATKTAKVGTIDTTSYIASLGELDLGGASGDQEPDSESDTEPEGDGLQGYKTICLSVLKAHELAARRAIKLHPSDYLKLLASLNDIGVHFSNV